MLRIAAALACCVALPAWAGTVRFDFTASWDSGDRPFVENGAQSYFSAPRQGYLEFDTSMLRGTRNCDIGGWMACDATQVTSYQGGVAEGVANMGGQMARFSLSDQGGWLTYIADTIWFSDPADSASRLFWSADFTLRLDPLAPTPVPLPGGAWLMLSALGLAAGLGSQRRKSVQ